MAGGGRYQASLHEEEDDNPVSLTYQRVDLDLHDSFQPSGHSLGHCVKGSTLRISFLDRMY